MAMTREEAEKLINRFQFVVGRIVLIREGGNVESDTYRKARQERYDLCRQLLTALCAEPNAALLETCKRLYAICDGLTARHVMDLSDEALERGTRGLVEGTDKIDLEWARTVIAAAEEKNRCQLAESGN